MTGEYFVGKVSDSAVTSAACFPRLLSVVRQVRYYCVIFDALIEQSQTKLHIVLPSYVRVTPKNLRRMERVCN